MGHRMPPTPRVRTHRTDYASSTQVLENSSPRTDRRDEAPTVSEQEARRSVLRREPLYQQIVADITARIESGELAPNQPLASESEMIHEYGVSRATVRNAMNALRMSGMVVTEHGRATRVRNAPTVITVNVDMTVHRHGWKFRTWEDAEQWAPGEGGHYRTDAGEYGEALDIPASEPVFVNERILRHETGAHAGHSLVIPFSVVLDTPLENDPFLRPAEMYEVLTRAGHSLTWYDAVFVDMDVTPDEIAALHLPPGGAVIVHNRVTLNTTGQGLLFEETRLPAHAAAIITTPAVDTKPGRGRRAT